MKKDIITWIVLLFIITSCASRKVSVSKLAEKTKVDSLVEVKVDGTYVKDNNIVTVDSTEEIEYVAQDTSKPMVINGKVFKNVIIKSKKAKKTTIDKTKEKKQVSSTKKLNVKKEDKKLDLNKKIDKRTNYFVYLWLIIIPIGVYFFRQIKNKLLL